MPASAISIDLNATIWKFDPAHHTTGVARITASHCQTETWQAGTVTMATAGRLSRAATASARRRPPGSGPSDQVRVRSLGCPTAAAKYSNWDAQVVRGRGSPGFTISATVLPEQILPVPFGQIMNETLVPVSHLLWSHVWMGIAGEAFERARKATRKAGGAGGTAKTKRSSASAPGPTGDIGSAPV